MPVTEKTTLDRIQEEIKEALEREKELKLLQNFKNSHESHTTNGTHENGINNNNNNNNNNNVEKQPQLHALTHQEDTSGTITTGNKAVSSSQTTSSTNNFRRFVPNANTKGVMQRFLKSKGKLLAISALTNTTTKNSYSYEAIASTAPGKRVRKGFVPIEERIKQEFEEAHQREHELRTLRKSRENLSASFSEDYLDEELPETVGNGMRATKSMVQLYDETSSENSLDCATVVSAPGSLLKPARSLAELIDAKDEEEIVRPQSLILQFEQLITKNKEAACT